VARPKLILIALIAVLTMSAVPVLIKSTDANEVTIGLARLAIAVLAFTPFTLWQGGLFRLSLQQWRQLVVIGLVFGIHWLTYFASINLATPAIAALIITTYSVMYLVLAYFFNGENVSRLEWLGIAGCLAGCAIVSPALNFTDAPVSVADINTNMNINKGIAIGLFSALLYAALPLLHQRASAISTLDRTWGQFFFAGLVFLPLWNQSDWQLQQIDIYQLLTLGLLCTVISHGLWVKASTELPAIYTSMIYYLYLPMTLLTSVLILDEELTVRKLTGVSLVISISLALSYNRYRRSRQAHG
jgi:drug/metabolite transporter (DMT)-like permease